MEHPSKHKRLGTKPKASGPTFKIFKFSGLAWAYESYCACPTIYKLNTGRKKAVKLTHLLKSDSIRCKPASHPAYRYPKQRNLSHILEDFYQSEDIYEKAKPWFTEECTRLKEKAAEASRLLKRVNTLENKERLRVALLAKARAFNRLKKRAKRKAKKDVDNYNEYDGIEECVNMLQKALDEAHRKPTEKAVFQHRADMRSKTKTWFNEECNELIEKALRARRRMIENNTPENIECFRLARQKKSKYIRQLKQMIPEDFDTINEYDTIDESVNLFQTVLDKAHGKPTEKEAYVAPPKVVQKQPEESIVIDDEDEVVEVSNNSPTKPNQPADQNKKQPNETNQPNQKNPQNRQQQQQQQQQQQRRGPPQQQQQQQQRRGRDRNRNPFADNRSPQRHHPFQQQQQQQQQDQRRSMQPWGQQDNQGPMWNDQQQQFMRQQDQFMPDDRFNRNNEGPFDRFDQGGRNMNQFEQMMLQQFGNFSMNQQNDNGFNRGPMDSDDPPLDRRGWGHQQQQQQRFNRFSPPRQRSPFGREFRDDASPDFGRDSPGIPANIPEDEIDEYIIRKQEAIKRRLEQLDKQLITSVESSRHRDYELAQRRRKGTVFSDNGDVHYVPNPAAVARNRERRAGRGRGSGAGRGRRDREENLVHRQRDPFADVDIVPIIRISEERSRSPSPKRNRDDAFDTAQFDAAWS